MLRGTFKENDILLTYKLRARATRCSPAYATRLRKFTVSADLSSNQSSKIGCTQEKHNGREVDDGKIPSLPFSSWLPIFRERGPGKQVSHQIHKKTTLQLRDFYTSFSAISRLFSSFSEKCREEKKLDEFGRKRNSPHPTRSLLLHY